MTGPLREHSHFTGFAIIQRQRMQQVRGVAKRNARQQGKIVAGLQQPEMFQDRLLRFLRLAESWIRADCGPPLGLVLTLPCEELIQQDQTLGIDR